MKISRVEVYRADIPFRQVSGAPLRTWQDTSSVVLVRAYTDTGLMGVGTATAIGFYLGITAGALVDTVVTLAPLLIDQDPFAIERVHSLMDHHVRGNQAAKAALDIALYDLMGQAAGRPVYDLLGGRTQTEPLPTATFALYVDTPDKMAGDVMRRYDEGFRAFEVKMSDPKVDVERVRAIREALGPEATIVADANGHWTVKEAIQIIRRLEPHDVLVEEPCHGITALEEVRRAVSLPIVADETCHTVEDAAEIIRHRAADLVSIKLMKAGGLWKAHRIGMLAEGAGLGYRVDGVRGETRVSNTASAHFATALRHPVAPGLMQHARLAEDVVIEGGLTFADGRVTVPDAPGLGLAVREYGELVTRVE